MANQEVIFKDDIIVIVIVMMSCSNYFLLEYN